MKYNNAELDLKENIESFINTFYVKNNTNNIRNVIQKLLKDRVDLGKVLDMLNGTCTMRMFDVQELYYISNGIYNAYKKFSEIQFKGKLLDPSLYFTEVEIRDYEDKSLNINPITSDTYTFHNVYRVTDKQFMIPAITAKELVEFVYQGFLRYDFEVQRESQKKTVNNVTYETVKIYQKSIRGIKQSMKSKKYKPTALSVNILDRGAEESHWYYDEEEHTLTVSKFDRNSLIDGMHRLYTLMECYSEDKNFDQIMQLNIFNMNLIEARDYVYQEGQKNPISKELLNKYNASNINALVANEIVSEGMETDNLLKGKIGDDKKDVFVLDKFTTYEKLADAIEDNFVLKINDKISRQKIKSHITNIFSYIFSLHCDEFEDIKLSRETSYKLDCNMIYAYMYVAKKLYGIKNWEETLEDIIYKFDYDYDGEFSTFLKPDTYEITKRNKALLYKHLIIKLEYIENNQ